MEKKTHLVVGKGEVGSALHKVLADRYSVSARDKSDDVEGQFDVLHLSYPWTENFVSSAKGYIEKYKPELVIVHSTVAVGTTEEIGSIAVHSPIRGVHPRLEEGIRTFVKYFGGGNAEEAARIFGEIGLQTRAFKDSRTTELLKILDTTYYGWNIVFEKEVKRLCDEMGLDLGEVYTVPNEDYNEGYEKLGKPNVRRPVLKHVPGKIGGHCIMENCEFLDDWLTRTIKERNKGYEE